MHPSLLIRPASVADRPALWAILEPTIRAGETYALPPDMSEADALAYWTGPGREVFVAEADGRLVGTYFLRANQLGGGDHVANCAYVTDRAARGRGIARRSWRSHASHGWRSTRWWRRAGGVLWRCNSTSSSAPTRAPCTSPRVRGRRTATRGLPAPASRLHRRPCHVPQAVARSADTASLPLPRKGGEASRGVSDAL